MVEGEIARIGIARQRPPFWRRLATIAHASVLEREMVAVSEPTSDFIEWAMESRGQVFYMRSFVDLRTEPRWLPDFVSPPQLKSEFIGRIAAAAQVNLAKVQTAELKALVSGSGDSSLQSQVR